VIYVDANVFLRALVRPTTPRDQAWARDAAELFRAVGAGAEEITTSDAVLAEVAFVLASPRQYGMAPPDIAARLKPILSLRGCKAPQKGIWLRALDVYASSPNLGFVDALSVAYAERPGIVLATFDSDFDAIPGITRWRP
jgi:predicted nucleic acid-binding protein